MSESAITRVPIFQAGTHRGREYTPADLDSVVRNFAASSSGPAARLPVPLAVGHEEEQDWLRRTDIPAAGWVARVYREGPTLFADFADLPPVIRKLIKGRRYTRVSAELYDSPPAGVPGTGKTLRRVALLGAEQPQLKTLGEIPVPDEFSEAAPFAPPPPCRLHSTHPVRMPDGCWAMFSEVTMNREQVIQQLAAHGMSAEVLAGMDDAALNECLRCLEAKDAGAKEAAAPDMDGMLAKMSGMMDGMKGQPDKMEMYKDCARKMSELVKKYGEGDATKADDVSPAMKKLLVPGDDKGADKMSEAQITALVQKAVADALETSVKGTLGTLTKFQEETLKAEQTRGVDAIVDRLGREGKLPPAEVEGTRRDLLLADKSVVHKFSEGGKEVTGTAFDLMVQRLDKRPSKFAEHFAGARPGKAGAADESEEVARVERFSEDPKFAPALRAAGQTPEEYVEQFKALRKANPRLTAEQFGVPASA